MSEMKRWITILLAAALGLSLCACGKKNETEAPAPTEDADITTPAPEARRDLRYRREEITAENWDRYFELAEVPLYSITSAEVIAQVYDNYCVVLRDEYVPYINPEGDYRVDFEFAFDVYVNTLDVDTRHYTYRHTDDLLYATATTKTAVFDRFALYKSAYGADQSEHKNYSNAFFSGWATIHPDSKVWSGFYIDLSAVRLVSVQGSIELAG